MKDKEILRLMIGDILMACHDDGETGHNFPVKVDGLDGNCPLVDGECSMSWKPMFPKDCNEEYADELNPIPLTAEILEYNGWKHANDVCYLHAKGVAGVDVWMEWRKKNQTLFLGEGLVPLPVHDVHQIQHALRLCGLTDLANNFKLQED